MSYHLPAETLAQIELLSGLNGLVEENLGLLAKIEDCWQPSDYLPDLGASDWDEQLRRFREPSMQLSDEILVVLIGDMVTEEALPNYAISLNLIARDIQGDSSEPWSRWMRGWVAEENRHGDLLNAYLRLTGRVDMRAVELTIHHLLASGFNPRAAPDLYAGLIYTAFQERATMLSHLNVGKLARSAGDLSLARICARIAGDESRHAAFYGRMMNAVVDQDPAGAILVFRNMMRRIISMPGKLMYDGKDPDLFEHFAIVAQRLGVYTVHHYAEIIAHLVSAWDIAGRAVSGKAAKAQEFLCVQAERIKSLADSVSEQIARSPATAFSWIYDRKA